MKSVGKDAVSRLHQREHMAAIKLQSKWRAKHGQLLAHMKKRLRAEEAEEGRAPGDAHGDVHLSRATRCGDGIIDVGYTTVEFM